MSTALLLAIVVVIAVVVVAMGREDKPTPRPKLPTHGNSALAGGYIDAGQVCFYAPTPVQQLQAALPGVEVVDCTQNGLTLGEALAGGSVRMGVPALGQTQATTESLATIWQRERPQFAYVALLEVDPLFDSQWTPARLVEQLQTLLATAQAVGVTPIVQGAIHFAVGGPVTSEGLARLDQAHQVALSWARGQGLPVVDPRVVPFDPVADVCADGLHPTAAMHARYTQTRAAAIAQILTTQGSQA